MCNHWELCNNAVKHKVSELACFLFNYSCDCQVLAHDPSCARKNCRGLASGCYLCSLVTGSNIFYQSSKELDQSGLHWVSEPLEHLQLLRNGDPVEFLNELNLHPYIYYIASLFYRAWIHCPEIIMFLLMILLHIGVG